MTFANFLDLGPHSQPKRKLINISGERGIIIYTCTKKAQIYDVYVIENIPEHKQSLQRPYN